MSKEHKEHAHHEHHAHVEAASQEQKILGLGVSTIALIAALVIVTAIIATWVGFGAGSMSATNNTNAQVQTIDKTSVMLTAGKYINDNFANNGITFVVEDTNTIVGGLLELNIYAIKGDANQLAGIAYANSEKLVLAMDKAMDMNKAIAKPVTEEPVTATPVKTDKPVVDLYVMSFCPFGNKAEDTMLPVYNLLKDKATFNVHFIVNTDGNNVVSLHGAPEVVQNEREACVLKNYDMNKLMNFMVYVNDNCGSNGSCWETGATALGIDKAKINACVASEGVALMKANEAASTAANANGSPTLLINGVNTTAVYQYGNSEAYKVAICNSFTTAPAECSAVLSGDATATTQGGSC
ncbi:MAG: hypothetical protein WCW44_05980 [archaeon]|jgi:hypothetical protein